MISLHIIAYHVQRYEIIYFFWRIAAESIRSLVDTGLLLYLGTNLIYQLLHLIVTEVDAFFLEKFFNTFAKIFS